MPSWRSGNIEANGITLHYTHTGGAKPHVVLAHGFSDDGVCWTPVAEALAPEYDVVMVDARGHGRSDAPEQGYGALEQAEDLAGVIEALGLPRPAVLGHSMGAATALALAGLHPDVPRAILLEDPPAWWVGAPQRSATDDEWRVRMRGWVGGLKRKAREELLAEQRAQTPNWSEAELGPWADAKHRLSLNVLGRSDDAPVDWPPLLGRITCPALLIAADPSQGAIVTEEDAAALKEMVPQLRIARIPEAGHSIRRDQFARYLEAVRSFLADPAAA